MLKNKNLFFSLLFLFVVGSSIVAQNNTNSPYTLYGFGDITENYSGEYRAMGGTSIASSSKNSINTVNPASYASVDSMTFMFDMGVSLLGSRFSYNDVYNSKINANLEYITMQFPLGKNMGFSMGLLPYSFTGYNYSLTQTLPLDAYPDTIIATQTYYGSGGISQVYGGLSIRLFKRLSLGVNGYYMFGNNMNTRVQSFSTSGFTAGYQKDTIKVASFRMRFGAQYAMPVGKTNRLSLGAYYEAKQKLNATYSESTGSYIDSITPTQSYFTDFELPQTFGIGVNYAIDNRITLAADYSLQQWSDVKYMGVVDTLTDRSRFSLGAEIIPNPRSRRYLNRVTYRLGFNMSDAYYKIDNKIQPKNFGITFGLGLPLRNAKSIVNATLEYGKVGTTSLLREDYLKFTLNAVINENWFFKRKL